MSEKHLVIDVVSDVICPWCFLGKRRLDKALLLVPEVQTQIRWRPYFLDPSIPQEGMDRHEYMSKKFGEERLKTIHVPLEEAGKLDDVPYRFDKITRTPNTLNAHRLIRWAAKAGKQLEIVEDLFVAYWHDGKDIGETKILSTIAEAHGMKRVRKDLATDKDKLEVFTEVQQAQSMGIQGVPTFILAQKFGVSGAQSAELLADGIRRAISN
jgi:predicted DsbA family dithiol-disulfide isomerase